MEAPLVLVTGVSGYIASHVAQQLLAAGYRVRGTVRSTRDEKKVAHLRDLYPGSQYSIELVEADLTREAGWAEAVAGCDYVLHVASPFPVGQPKDEQELIGPAVSGTRYVLAAVAAQSPRTVRRVVLTSSIASVYFGHDAHARVFDESVWSELADPRHPVMAYAKSKTLAEKAAWDLLAALPPHQHFQLNVINPGFVIGPKLNDAPCTSAEPLVRMLQREMPAIPELYLASVDVRDVARAHIAAMTVPQHGQRYIVAPYDLSFRDMALLLEPEFKQYGYSVPTGKLPSWLVTVGAWFDAGLATVASSIGKRPRFTSAKAEVQLGMKWRPVEDSVLSFAYSLIVHGHVKDRSVGGKLKAQGGPRGIGKVVTVNTDGIAYVPDAGAAASTSSAAAAATDAADATATAADAAQSS